MRRPTNYVAPRVSPERRIFQLVQQTPYGIVSCVYEAQYIYTSAYEAESIFSH